VVSILDRQFAVGQMNTEERLTELESRLEFQDETIATLNDEIARHQHRIAELEKSFKLVVERLRDRTEQTDPAAEPPPPHY
jgi:SlyX protein